MSVIVKELESPGINDTFGRSLRFAVVSQACCAPGASCVLELNAHTTTTTYTHAHTHPAGHFCATSNFVRKNRGRAMQKFLDLEISLFSDPEISAFPPPPCTKLQVAQKLPDLENFNFQYCTFEGGNTEICACQDMGDKGGGTRRMCNQDNVRLEQCQVENLCGQVGVGGTWTMAHKDNVLPGQIDIFCGRRGGGNLDK